MKNLIASITCIFAGLFASAHAATVDLTNLNVNFGAEETVIVIDDTYELVIAAVTITGGFDNPTFDLTSGLISDDSGLGVLSGVADPGQVDGLGVNEGVFFEVRKSGTGEVVEFTKFTFNLAFTNDDYSIFAGNGFDDLEGIVESADIDPLNQIAMTSIKASSLVIAALEPDDGFFIESITFEAIPVPGALPLMAAGLGGLTFLRRRKRSN